jgi:hypothetical protein
MHELVKKIKIRICMNQFFFWDECGIINLTSNRISLKRKGAQLSTHGVFKRDTNQENYN